MNNRDDRRAFSAAVIGLAIMDRHLDHFSMEFFAVSDTETETSEQALRAVITISALPRLCSAIDKVLIAQGERGRIYCLWGEFAVHREDIAGGVRFTLPGCPNALQWTITTGFPPARDGVVIHCTINRQDHEPDFIESICTFVAAWREGLERALSRGSL